MPDYEIPYPDRLGAGERPGEPQMERTFSGQDLDGLLPAEIIGDVAGRGIGEGRRVIPFGRHRRGGDLAGLDQRFQFPGDIHLQLAPALDDDRRFPAIAAVDDPLHRRQRLDRIEVQASAEVAVGPIVDLTVSPGPGRNPRSDQSGPFVRSQGRLIKPLLPRCSGKRLPGQDERVDRLLHPGLIGVHHLLADIDHLDRDAELLLQQRLLLAHELLQPAHILGPFGVLFFRQEPGAGVGEEYDPVDPAADLPFQERPVVDQVVARDGMAGITAQLVTVILLQVILIRDLLAAGLAFDDICPTGPVLDHQVKLGKIFPFQEGVAAGLQDLEPAVAEILQSFQFQVQPDQARVDDPFDDLGEVFVVPERPDQVAPGHIGIRRGRGIPPGLFLYLVGIMDDYALIQALVLNEIPHDLLELIHALGVYDQVDLVHRPYLLPRLAFLAVEPLDFLQEAQQPLAAFLDLGTVLVFRRSRPVHRMEEHLVGLYYHRLDLSVLLLIIVKYAVDKFPGP